MSCSGLRGTQGRARPSRAVPRGPLSSPLGCSRARTTHRARRVPFGRNAKGTALYKTHAGIPPRRTPPPAPWAPRGCAPLRRAGPGSRFVRSPADSSVPRAECEFVQLPALRLDPSVRALAGPAPRRRVRARGSPTRSPKSKHSRPRLILKPRHSLGSEHLITMFIRGINRVRASKNSSSR